MSLVGSFKSGLKLSVVDDSESYLTADMKLRRSRSSRIPINGASLLACDEFLLVDRLLGLGRDTEIFLNFSGSWISSCPLCSNWTLANGTSRVGVRSRGFVARNSTISGAFGRALWSIVQQERIKFSLEKENDQEIVVA